MAEIKQTMPEGVDYQIVYDTTQFVRASIEAVVHTLLEAVLLVVLVVILFLQTWRASIIPLIAVPVSIIGTRSEEHTSELQSLMRISYAVFCLKKKKKRIP